MLHSKGTLIGAAAALVVSTVLLAGLVTSGTTGAATDAVKTATPTNTAVVAVPTVAPAPPPAAPIEPPTAPLTNPDGSQLGANGAPAGGTAGLPNAGYGVGNQAGGQTAVLFMLLGIVGAGLAGLGASIASRRQG